jgi:hypothetical protein
MISVRRALTAAATAGLAFSLGVGVVLGSASPAVAGASVPYDDHSAEGYIGLCNREGQPIRSGSVTDAPFPWSAFSSVAAPAPYNQDGRTATLFAYQPRQGLTPPEWSGEMVSASARYSNPAHPQAQSTERDEPLRTFLDTYPPQWDGLIQLRLYLGAPDQPARTQRYAATDIRISGDRWEVVRGGDVACDSGTAVSLEDQTLPPLTASTLPPESVATTAPTTPVSIEASPSTVEGHLAGADEQASSDVGAGDSSSGTVLAVVGAVLAVAVAAAVALIIRARAHRQASP